jgi:hypothetical protein
MTDELSSYTPPAKFFADHQTVQHGTGEYVRGTAHVNTAEGFFSLLKRGINGTFHHVGKKHLGRYVDEFAFRYNSRKTTDAQRAELAVKGAEGKRLMYRKPVTN